MLKETNQTNYQLLNASARKRVLRKSQCCSPLQQSSLKQKKVPQKLCRLLFALAGADLTELERQFYWQIFEQELREFYRNTPK